MRNGRTTFGASPTNRQPALPFRTPNSALRILFVAQRHYRIEARRSARRPDAEEQPDRGAEDERQENRERRNERVPVRQSGQDYRTGTRSFRRSRFSWRSSSAPRS